MKPVISAHNVSKRFIVPHEKISSLRENITGLFRAKTYETFHAVKKVSFSVEAGEFFGIIGRNGCGKSTLLKLLAQIYKPNDGSIKTIGRVSPFLELGVGFNPELTAKENVFLNGVVLGLSHRQVEEKYPQIVAFSGLKKFMDMKLKNFSSGMQVRLAFSVAIQAEADIFLIDEVLAVGDAEFQAKCFEIFRQLKRKGKTIIFVSHDLGAIQEFCDRVLLLDGGEICLVDTPTKVITKYQNLTEERMLESKTKPVSGKKLEHELGLGTIVITNVDFIDKSGHQPLVFSTGESIELRIHYQSRITIAKPVVGLAFFSQDGHNLSGPNTKIDHYSLPPIGVKTHGVIRYQIPHLPFTAGEYDVSVGFFDWDCRIPYTFREKAFRFKVKTRIPNFSGAFHLEGIWHKA